MSTTRATHMTCWHTWFCCCWYWCCMDQVGADEFAVAETEEQLCELLRRGARKGGAGIAEEDMTEPFRDSVLTCLGDRKLLSKAETFKLLFRFLPRCFCVRINKQAYNTVWSQKPPPPELAAAPGTKVPAAEEDKAASDAAASADTTAVSPAGAAAMSPRDGEEEAGSGAAAAAAALDNKSRDEHEGASPIEWHTPSSPKLYISAWSGPRTLAVIADVGVRAASLERNKETEAEAVAIARKRVAELAKEKTAEQTHWVEDDDDKDLDKRPPAQLADNAICEALEGWCNVVRWLANVCPELYLGSEQIRDATAAVVSRIARCDKASRPIRNDALFAAVAWIRYAIGAAELGALPPDHAAVSRELFLSPALQHIIVFELLPVCAESYDPSATERNKHFRKKYFTYNALRLIQLVKCVGFSASCKDASDEQLQRAVSALLTVASWSTGDAQHLCIRFAVQGLFLVRSFFATSESRAFLDKAKSNPQEHNDIFKKVHDAVEALGAVAEPVLGADQDDGEEGAAEMATVRSSFAELRTLLTLQQI